MEEVRKARQYEITRGYIMALNGWVNCWDRMPDEPGEYLVEDRVGNRFKVEAVISFGHMAWYVGRKGYGYDICWWKERGKQ